MTNPNWRTWDLPADLESVPGLRETIHRASIRPLLDRGEAENFRRTVLETFGEALETYLNENELRWRCDVVTKTFPNLPMQAVFRAIELEIGVSTSRLSKIWYGDIRRKARLTEIISRKLKERQQ